MAYSAWKSSANPTINESMKKSTETGRFSVIKKYPINGRVAKKLIAGFLIRSPGERQNEGQWPEEENLSPVSGTGNTARNEIEDSIETLCYSFRNSAVCWNVLTFVSVFAFLPELPLDKVVKSSTVANGNPYASSVQTDELIPKLTSHY